MSTETASMVICTKDRPGCLRKCLNSILVNTVLPAEILIIDQSSNEDTVELIRELAVSSLVDIRCVPMKPQGLAAARNLGTKVSRGEVIIFTDDDCTAHLGWIEAVMREFKDPSVSCVCGHTLPADHSDRPRPALLSTLNHSSRKKITGKCNPIMLGRGNNMAFRKADLLNLGGFNEMIGVGTPVFAGEDLDVFYRLLESGKIMVHLPDAVVMHSQPDDWRSIVLKKRGYSISASAILACRIRHGDIYAASLLIGKISYEFVCLFLGGLVRGNRQVISIGWHSFIGSLSGLKYIFNDKFSSEVHRLTMFARESVPSISLINQADNEPCAPHR